MAITIVATAGSATANSYITLSDAEDLIDGLVKDDDVVLGPLPLLMIKTALYTQRRSGLIAKDF